MKKSIIFALLCVASLSFSCKKAKGPYTILSHIYKHDLTQTCSFPDNDKLGHPMHTTFTLDNLDTKEIYGLNVKAKFQLKSENNSYKPGLDRNINIYFNDKEVEMSKCIYFASSEYIDITAQIITNDGELSKPYKFRVPRP